MDHNPNAIEIFNNNASLYEQKYMDVSMYSNSLNTFCSALPTTSEILELACGPGNVTKYILEKKPTAKILATDLAPKMLALAKTNCPNATTQLLDLRSIAQLNKRFNAIVCAFGFPYLTKDEAIHFISDAASLLLSDGMIYLSTMEDEYSLSGIQTSNKGEEIYMYFHEASYLKGALESKGFHLVLEERIRTTDLKGKEVVDLILIAKI